MNHPSVSKINYSALLIQIVGLLVIFDVIPAEAQEPIVGITMLVVPTLIQIFRTWFTDP